jgi:hypothetical protein
MPPHLQGRIARLSRLISAAVVIWTIASGCGGSNSASDESVLKVAAPFGLSSFRDLNGRVGGSNTNAVDLLLDPIDRYAEIVRVEDRYVYIQPRPANRASVDDLVRTLRGPGVVGVRLGSQQQLIVELLDPESAQLLATGEGGFAMGPYEFDDENLDQGWIRLRSRGEAVIDFIELVEVDASEQWRRLHAHAIDVVPFSPAASLDAYTGMSSIRTVDYPVTGYVALYFNTRHAELASAAVRRLMSTIIDRRAIATVACGAADCATDWSSREPVAASLPSALGILVLGSDSVAVDAARTLRLQLENAGVSVDLDRVDIETLSVRLNERRFDLLVAPLAGGNGSFRSFRKDSPFNLGGWSHTEFEAAVERGDDPTALRILQDEVPATPLFWDRQFAAIDSAFCGGKPVDASWRWLAEVSPCAEATR